MLFAVDIILSSQARMTVYVMARSAPKAASRAWRHACRGCGSDVYPVKSGVPYVRNMAPEMGYLREGITVGTESVSYSDRSYWQGQADGCLSNLCHSHVLALCKDSPVLRAYILLCLCGASSGCLRFNRDLYVKAMGLSYDKAMAALKAAVGTGLLELRSFVGADGFESQYVSDGMSVDTWLTEGKPGHGLIEAAEFGWEAFLRDRVLDEG